MKEIVIPDSVQTIGDYAFYNCQYLQSATLPKELQVIGTESFGNCGSLQSANLPNKLQTIGNFAFEHCSSLQSVDIPDSVKTLGYYCFAYCSKLKEVTIGAGVEDIQTRYDHWSYSVPFFSCSSLEKITVSAQNKKYYSSSNCVIMRETGALIVGCKTSVIPTDGSIKRISECAFYGVGLRKITIATSVTYFGEYSFRDNSNLYYIYYLGTVAQWNKVSKYDGWNSGTTNYKIYCTDGIINYDGSVDPLPEA